MKISLDTAMKNGWKRMTGMLFRPFDMAKWLVIGFASFLASLGRGGGINLNFPSGNYNENGGNDFQAVQSWLMEHLAAVIFVAAGLFLIAFAVAVLFGWLSSRGKFVFLHAIAENKAEIREPWSKYRHLGDNLFFFRLIFSILSLVSLLIVAGLSILLAIPFIKSQNFTLSFFMLMFLFVILIVTLVFIILTVKVVLMDFVVPIMFKKNIPAMPAFRVFYDEMCRGHVWDLTLFYIVKFGLGLAAGVVVMIGTCCTCCVAALPYISSVVFLPVAVFMESFTLAYIAQHGEEWDLFAWKLEGEVPPVQPPSPEPPPPEIGA